MLMNTHEARLEALRKELKAGGLDGFVIPISDEHMSEYVGGYAQRLAWLTGFGGSAGTAVVLADRAAIFVELGGLGHDLRLAAGQLDRHRELFRRRPGHHQRLFPAAVGFGHALAA